MSLSAPRVTLLTTLSSMRETGQFEIYFPLAGSQRTGLDGRHHKGGHRTDPNGRTDGGPASTVQQHRRGRSGREARNPKTVADTAELGFVGAQLPVSSDPVPRKATVPYGRAGHSASSSLARLRLALAGRSRPCYEYDATARAGRRSGGARVSAARTSRACGLVSSRLLAPRRTCGQIRHGVLAVWSSDGRRSAGSPLSGHWLARWLNCRSARQLEGGYSRAVHHVLRVLLSGQGRVSSDDLVYGNHHAPHRHGEFITHTRSDRWLRS